MKKITIFNLLLLHSLLALAQDGFQARIYETKKGQKLPYQILYPENYNRHHKYPLVLVLHGAGERGADNQKQLVHGSKLFLSDNNRRQFPAIVIFPQCPVDSYWMSGKIDRSKQPIELSFDYPKAPNWPLKAAVELVKKLSKKEAVDKKRIYITGLSMGGMGTFEALARYPKLFAAAAPICGGGNLEMTKKYANKVPLWIFHGAEDGVVKVQNSRDMYAALRANAANVKYTEYPGVNHNSWDNAFAESEFLPWMFSHVKGKK